MISELFNHPGEIIFFFLVFAAVCFIGVLIDEYKKLVRKEQKKILREEGRDHELQV